MKYTITDVVDVAFGISNSAYSKSYEATKQLMELFDDIASKPWLNIIKKPLDTVEAYIRTYDDNFYTYQSWEDLVESEEEQGVCGYTEEQLEKLLNRSIWQLPCGWYVQYV